MTEQDPLAVSQEKIHTLEQQILSQQKRYEGVIAEKDEQETQLLFNIRQII